MADIFSVHRRIGIFPLRMWDQMTLRPENIPASLMLFHTGSRQSATAPPLGQVPTKGEKVDLDVCRCGFSLPSRHIFWQQGATDTFT